MIGVQTQYRQVAEAFARRLVEEAPEVEAVVLYGSVARGEAHQDSDIDLVVLTEGDAKSLDERAGSLALVIEEEFRESQAFIQVIAKGVADFRSRTEIGSPWERTIALMGVPLFDRGAFASIHEGLQRVSEERAPYRPSSKVLQEFLESAEEALAEANFLLGGDFWDGVSNRAYYAMFNAASAAVLVAGVPEIRSHKALVGLFQRRVARDRDVGQQYADDLEHAFKLRLRADYERGFRVDEAAARDAIDRAERFIARMREFLAQNPEPRA